MTTLTPAPDDRSSAISASRERLIGIGLMCAALACFACLDALAKWLGTQMDPMQVVWARYASAMVIMVVIFNPIRQPDILVTRKPVVQGVRSVLLLASTALNFFALQYLQLDQTVAIMFATPFLVAVLAGPALGEWIGPRRWAAVLVGFAGILVITRPWSGEMHWAMVLSLIGAGCYAVYGILTRLLAGHDSAGTTSIYSLAAGVVVGTALVPLVWTTPPSLAAVVGMIAIGAFGGFGHWMLIRAHEKAPAAILSPFIYTQMVWMVTLGWVFFSQTPDRNTLLGAGIVIASGLYLLYRERTVQSSGR